MMARLWRFNALFSCLLAWFLTSCAPPPPPMMAPHMPAEAVKVCAGGECGKAGERFALEDIAKATATMMKVNSPGVWDFCEADPQTRQCISDRLSYPVHNIITATGHVPQGALRGEVRYDGKGTVNVRVNIPTIIFNTAAICDDARSTFSFRSAKHFVWFSNPYKCSWGGGPHNILAEGRMGIDFIDFDRGLMGGEYIIRVSEGGNGYGTGYMMTRLSTGMKDAQAVWLQPKQARPVLAAPATPQPPPSLVPAPLAYSQAAAPVTISNPEVLGKYHALVIGNNGYRHLPKLRSAVADARSVARLLKERYGFQVRLLLDADRSTMLTEFERLRRSLTPEDNLLIYYAGHGWLDVESDEGFWLPVDADRESQIQWISNATVTGILRAMLAKHVIVVADSCYSGKLSRGLHLTSRTPDYLLRISRKRARVVMSSGGLEPVMDSGGAENHSVFTGAFLRALQENQDILDGTRLFSQIRRRVMLSADQTPEYADIRKAGHDGGDFLFAPR